MTRWWNGSALPRPGLRGSRQLKRNCERCGTFPPFRCPIQEVGTGWIPIASFAGRAYSSTRLFYMDAAANRRPGRDSIAIEPSKAAPCRPSHVPAFPLSRFPLFLLVYWLALVTAVPACAAIRFDMFVGYDGIVPQ